MTLYQFNQSDETSKFDRLWEHGVFLADRNDAGHRIALYQLFSFYVEVRYDPTGNEILGLRSFSSTNPLEPYLDQIDLETK